MKGQSQILFDYYDAIPVKEDKEGKTIQAKPQKLAHAYSLVLPSIK